MTERALHRDRTASHAVADTRYPRSYIARYGPIPDAVNGAGYLDTLDAVRYKTACRQSYCTKQKEQIEFQSLSWLLMAMGGDIF